MNKVLCERCRTILELETASKKCSTCGKKLENNLIEPDLGPIRFGDSEPGFYIPRNTINYLIRLVEIFKDEGLYKNMVLQIREQMKNPVLKLKTLEQCQDIQNCK